VADMLAKNQGTKEKEEIFTAIQNKLKAYVAWVLYKPK
jgi:hypothetical protein